MLTTRAVKLNEEHTNTPIFRSSIEVSNSCPAAIRSTTSLIPECKVGSISKAFPYLQDNIKIETQDIITVNGILEKLALPQTLKHTRLHLCLNHSDKICT